MVVLLGAVAAAGCIDWESAETEFCADNPTAMGCERDAGQGGGSGGGGGTDGGADAGPDAGMVDAGSEDAGADAGTADAGADAGTADAGADAGTADAGVDAGPPPPQITFILDGGMAGASGRIEWADGGGLICDLAQSPCVLSFDAGMVLQLRGVPAHMWDVLVNFSGCTPPVHGKCDLTVSANATIAANFDRPNLAFVTSGFVNGGFAWNPDGGANFNPVATANAICAEHAADAGLPGLYLAFIGVNGTSYNPTGGANIGRARGWLRVDGKPVFDQLQTNSHLSQPLYPLVLTEKGDNVQTAPQPILTGMTSTGIAGGTTCNDYTNPVMTTNATAGMPSMGGQLWANYLGPYFCNGTFRLACFGVDRRVPVRVDRSEPTRLAFVTANPWEVDGGLAAADAFCADEALAYGVTGTFNAYLYRPGNEAVTRLNGVSSVPWARPDGVMVVPDVASFVAGANLEAPMTNQPSTYFWVGSAQNHCTTWTLTPATGNPAPRGRGFDCGTNWNGTNVNDPFAWCDSTSTRLLCFQR